MSWTVFYFPLLVFILTWSELQGLKCYHCGGQDEPSCSDFETEEDFEVECPAASKGCMTSSLNDDVIAQRSCWATADDSCNSPGPNEHRICTCGQDLCNCYDSAGDEDESDGCRMPEQARLQNEGAATTKNNNSLRFLLLAMPVLVAAVTVSRID